MPGSVAPVADERSGLIAFLAQQRDCLKVAAFGLSDEQARLVPTASALSVGGIIKHVTGTERQWIDLVLGNAGGSEGGSENDYLDGFTMRDDETLEDLIARYDEVAAAAADVFAAIGLDYFVEAPDQPWFNGVDGWSVRWVLLHLIEETARHAGHADIVRECVDGATAFPLMAAAEGWPETPWMKPWTPGPVTV